MISKKIFAGLLVFVLLLALVPGCAVSEFNAIELVPENVNLIAGIQVGQMVNDQALRGAYEEVEKGPDIPPKVEEALDDVLEKTGIDLRDVSQAVVFADITDMEAMDVEEYLGIVVEGKFDEGLIIDRFEENGEMDFTISEYQGYKIYIDQDEGLIVTFLSEKMLLLGSTKAVYDTIDVSKGEKEKAGGVLVDTYNRFGDAMIKVAIGIPEESRESMTEEPVTGEMPISLETFADVETIGFAFNRNLEMVTIQVDFHFLSADSATDARDTLSGTVSVFKGMSQDERVKDLLSKIEVGVDGSWVTIDFAVALAEIENLMETFRPTAIP